MKMLSFLEGNEEAALNDVSRKTWSNKRPETLSVCFENECSPRLLQGKTHFMIISDSNTIYYIHDNIKYITQPHR